MTTTLIVSSIIFIISAIVLAQSALFLYAMIYAWVEPNRVIKNGSPGKFSKPHFSFTVLLPARHEEEVIADTIRAVSKIDYPEEKKEILVILRDDDLGTIKVAEQAIKELGKENIKTVVFSGYPINKPHGMNKALPHATKDVLVIFDAEDEPHRNIFNIVNTVMLRDNADVVQAGVQLVNYSSNWFSSLNVLEYYFWFKSALHLFNKIGVTPLGGNTVFFKKEIINQIGGWDQEALTEDAEIGLNLSKNGANISLVYDSCCTTHEETPHNIENFIKQRTRWSQGFLQVLLKKHWQGMDSGVKKILATYLLAWPEIQAIYFLYIPISLLTILFVKLPVWLAMFSTLPMFTFILMFIVLNIGLYEFTRDYKFKYYWWLPLKMAITFYPYQILLGFSALRAVFRQLAGNMGWEKTTHLNVHRTAAEEQVTT